MKGGGAIRSTQPFPLLSLFFFCLFTLLKIRVEIKYSTGLITG